MDFDFFVLINHLPDPRLELNGEGFCSLLDTEHLEQCIVRVGIPHVFVELLRHHFVLELLEPFLTTSLISSMSHPASAHP